MDSWHSVAALEAIDVENCHHFIPLIASRQSFQPDRYSGLSLLSVISSGSDGGLAKAIRKSVMVCCNAGQCGAPLHDSKASIACLISSLFMMKAHKKGLLTMPNQ
jgi:hypothetical protein